MISCSPAVRTPACRMVPITSGWSTAEGVRSMTRAVMKKYSWGSNPVVVIVRSASWGRCTGPVIDGEPVTHQVGLFSGETATGQPRRVKVAFELLAGQVGLFQRHINHGPPAGERFLGNGRRLFIADHRIQRGDQNRVAVNRLGQALMINGKAG